MKFDNVIQWVLPKNVPLTGTTGGTLRPQTVSPKRQGENTLGKSH
jgi:hypothetical protein